MKSSVSAGSSSPFGRSLPHSSCAFIFCGSFPGSFSSFSASLDAGAAPPPPGWGAAGEEDGEGPVSADVAAGAGAAVRLAAFGSALPPPRLRLLGAPPSPLPLEPAPLHANSPE